MQIDGIKDLEYSLVLIFTVTEFRVVKHDKQVSHAELKIVMRRKG